METLKDNEALVTLIKNTHQLYMRETLADAAGISTSATSEDIKLRVEAVKGRYEILRAHVRRELKVAGMKRYSDLDKEQLREDTEHSREAIRLASTEERILADRKLRLAPMSYDWQNYKWRPYVEVLFFAGELILNAYALAVLGGTLLAALVAAAVVGAALCVVSIYIGLQYKSKQGEERKIFVKQSVICMAAVFLSLSILRSLAAFAKGEMLFSWSIAGGMVIYFVINALVFFGAVVFGTTLPTREDRKLKHEHDEVDAQLVACRAVMSREREAMRSRRHSDAERTRERIEKMADAKYYGDIITGYCNEAVLAFSRQLTMRRGDGLEGYVLK